MAAIIAFSSLPLRTVCASVHSKAFERRGSAHRSPFRSASLVCPSPRIQRSAVQRHASFEGTRGGARCAIRATAGAGAAQSGNPSELHRFRRALAMAVARFVVLKSAICESAHRGAAGMAGSIRPHEAETLACLKGSLARAVSPLCFAAMSRSTAAVNTPLTVVASGMAKWLELYSGVLMVRVLLSWFPNIPWERQPLQAMRDMCDPYLNLYRNIIPPLFNALDLSPLLAFLVLGLLSSILNTSIRR